jgi:hypothetical protein
MFATTFKPALEISQMNPAEQEVVRQFCYEVALILRRITGRGVDNKPADLATVLDEE